METWSAHHLYHEAASRLGAETALSLQKYATRLIGEDAPVIFSLGHLGKICDVPFKTLRETVQRRRERSNYRMYPIQKRSGGKRFIHSVSNDLFRVQQFLNKELLQKRKPHASSFAFHANGGIRQCAAMHCGARWLLNFDLKDFFYSVTERHVYRIFADIGYRPLVAFELGRLCTTTRLPRAESRRNDADWMARQKRRCEIDELFNGRTSRTTRWFPYSSAPVGVLPQGAPSSPMLSNLAARTLDIRLSSFAMEHGMVYTRYADDITLSCSHLPDRLGIGALCKLIVDVINKCGFSENREKRHIAGPGSKKVVLGLLVDGRQPRISREMYRRIDHLLYGARRHTLAGAASHEGFESAFGFLNHLKGLVCFVKDVDRPQWEEFDHRLREILNAEVGS